MAIVTTLLLIAAPHMSMVAVSAADNEESAKKPSSRIVCKKMPSPVGTRLRGRKVCKSAAEWAAEKADMKEIVERAQQRTPLSSN